MNLLLRVATSQTYSQGAEVARQLLKIGPGQSLSLLQRMAISNGDSQRTAAARQLLKSMPPSDGPGYAGSLLYRIAANHRDCPPAEAAPRPLSYVPGHSVGSLPAWQPGHGLAAGHAGPPGSVPAVLEPASKCMPLSQAEPAKTNATPRVHTGASSGGVGVVVEVLIAPAKTMATADAV